MRARSEWFTWAPLTFLGQHSLVVFTTHVVVAEIILGLPQCFETGAAARATGNALLIAAMFAAAGARLLVRSDSFARFAKLRQFVRDVQP